MQKRLYGIGIVSFLIILSGHSQNLVVEAGSFTVMGTTCLTLSETSLVNNSLFSAADSSTLTIIGTNNNEEIGGSSDIDASNLNLDSDCNLNTNLILSGNLTMSSGLFTLNYNLVLGGKIEREREDSRITSLGSGELITTVSLVTNQPINPGNIGITIIPENNYDKVEFRRGHQSINNGALHSINRYYIIPEFVESTIIQFNYFDAELNGLTEGNLVLSGEHQNTWIPSQFVSSDLSNNLFTGTFSQPVSRISLFEGNSLANVDIPTGFSPNSDGVNDFFIIKGLENYPNNQLIIFNQWGNVLFEASPYQNDWQGRTESAIIKTNNQILLDGTYFFIFYPDKNDKQKFKSGYVETKTEDKL